MYPVLKFMRGTILRPTAIYCWVAFSLSLALSGPFGTYESFTLAWRLGFWFLVVGLSIVVGLMSRVAVRAWIAPTRLRDEKVLTVILMSALLSPILWEVILVFERPGKPALSFGGVAAFVLWIASAVCVVRTALAKQFDRFDSPDDGALEPPLLARLAQPVRGEIQMLTARDHYVDVVTDRGTEALLMRFADAIAELGGIDGVQVHRSHWVARKVVAGSVRREGRLFLRLDCGTEIPVSRKYRGDVETAGLV